MISKESNVATQDGVVRMPPMHLKSTWTKLCTVNAIIQYRKYHRYSTISNKVKGSFLGTLFVKSIICHETKNKRAFIDLGFETFVFQNDNIIKRKSWGHQSIQFVISFHTSLYKTSLKYFLH